MMYVKGEGDVWGWWGPSSETGEAANLTVTLI